MITNHDRKSFGSRWKNSKSWSDDWHRRFWSAFRCLGTHFVESFCMSKSSWMMEPTCPREMPSCSAIDLGEIWWSSKISSLIWSIISRGGHCFGSSRTRHIIGGKITFKLGHPVFDGEFLSVPCLAGKETWWRLASPCCWNRARHLTYFLSASVTRKDLAHKQTPISNDTISSVYDIGK